MRHPAARSAQRGFSLLEVLSSLVILAVVGGLSLQAVGVTSRASAATTFQSELTQRAHRTIGYLARQLQEARGASLVPVPDEPFGTSVLTFQCAEVPDTEEIVWGANRRIELVPSPGDPRDGRDNDHDGFVDEHELRIVHEVGTPGERTTVLARNVAALLAGETDNGLDDNENGLVDEPGFCISQRDGLLNLRLSLQGKDPDGRIVTRTVEMTVWPRN